MAIDQIITFPDASADRTVKLFDNFYNYELVVPVDQYDVILAYFNKVTASRQSAMQLTSGLFRVAHASNIDVMELFSTIDGQDEYTLSATLAYYYNGIRDASTLLGISQPTKPNFYAARNIVL